VINHKNVLGEPPFASDQEELKWVLITRFYEDSVLRYGPNSEVARALLKFIDRMDYCASGQKSVELLAMQTANPNRPRMVLAR
jgi:hypothetical protein